ncbi:MAG: glutathione S-transferase family protein [Pseudomonadota bacterium]
MDGNAPRPAAAPAPASAPGHRLTQFRLCPASRAVRLALGELGIEVVLEEERPWEMRAAFLALNPAGELPVLTLMHGAWLCGAYAIVEYVAEEVQTHPHDGGRVPLFPGTPEARAEVRRLVDWFQVKFAREVSRDLLSEKVYSRFDRASARAPNADMMRAVRANLRYHLSYIAYLAYQRRWLAGDDLSFADMAAAAHVSLADFLNEVPWSDYPYAKEWYQRVKSRKAFQPLLSDRVPGVVAPHHYADLDF